MSSAAGKLRAAWMTDARLARGMNRISDFETAV